MSQSLGSMRKIAAFASGFFFCLFFVVIYFVLFSHGDLAGAGCSKDYPLTSKSLDCSGYDSSVARMKAVDQAFDTAAAKYISEGKAVRVSIWSRNLESGQWSATNETERYAPASLMKVPLMIAYYKLAETDPSILNRQLQYATSSQSVDSLQDMMPETLFQTGQSYSTQQLIEEMIIYSDNHSANVLLANINIEFFKKVLVDLGISIPGTMKNHDFITAKSYAAIFRTLYNATYLNREYSEKALEILLKTKFNAFDVSLPASVQVADKFGEEEVVNVDGSVNTRELHECGIVYKSPDAYSLCIMTEGKNFDDLKKIISEISALAYEKI